MKIFSKIFGDGSSSFLKKTAPIVEKINSLEESLLSLTNEDLKRKTTEFKERLEKEETLDDILPEAFAVVREISKRVLGLRHFDVQLVGGICMHQGSIAEMKTGEGKTLMATLATYLNALEGKGVHVVTVNDYLSRRDAVWMGQVYHSLGLSVAVISDNESFAYDPEYATHDEERDEEGSFKVFYEYLRSCTRPEAYQADITYGTNNQFGFDYLRDNVEQDRTRLRSRGYHYAIVDEIDSILIDEARTPLILSAPAGQGENLYDTFSKIVDEMKGDETHFVVDEQRKAINLTQDGITFVEEKLGIENIYTEGGIKYVHHLETAIRAKALFLRDRDYVVKEDQVIIVDPFTGRMQPGRRWSEGLHQAVESKEGVMIQQESRTLSSVTYQNFFRMYDKLSGMTGTAETSAEEFFKVYGLETRVIPTNQPIARDDKNDLIFQTTQGKFKAIAKRVKEIQETGQPVLIGTVAIEDNEALSHFLREEGVEHKVLNAKQHEHEGEIVAQAGIKGSVTIATNMAGRGVDIKLGGNPGSDEMYEDVKTLGGLYVIGTERHEARRIDNQLRGRSGRQGDPGETQFFVSLEDHLMRVFASDTMKKMMGRFGIPEDQPIENRLITRSLEKAQEKIEGFHFDARKNTLQFDDVLNRQRQAIYAKRRGILLGDNKDVAEYLETILAGASKEERAAIEKKREDVSNEDIFTTLIRRVALQTTDIFWMEHLEVMDYMRSSVNLRAYGQRDPLVEYKREGLMLFKKMEEGIDHDIRTIIPRVNIEVLQEQVEKTSKTIDASSSGEEKEEKKQETIVNENKIGRNDPCHCGSGKKYKKCHGQS
jgi:preprotein translocase subunit SecA